ncbi:hypothetical protein [uncultured Dokdonia sp.]|uniref:hypothetical protein n=1 Tax=uncultured Dokdonia sp. TaxID=575653 RepID=UPI00260E29F5|nr:hypothetical protein [uncultured Dokdonia sp.]
MTITEYIPFIQDQFQNIKQQYRMNWGGENNDYIYDLSSDSVSLSFMTERREEGMRIVIKNLKANEYYTIFGLIKIKNPDNNYLTEQELNISKGYKDQIKGITYVSAIFLERFCQDVLSGDFLQVGPGLPS